MAHMPCPDIETFERLIRGQLGDDDERVASHLAECDRCAATIESLNVNDTLIAAIQSRSSAPADPDQAVIAALVERLQLVGPFSASGGAERSQELSGLLAPPREPGELGWLGPYRVLRILGIGGMGIVFEAEDLQLQRRVALKALKPLLAANESAHRRFLREARAMAALRHDHIVTIYQVSEDRGIPFLAMERLQGEPLESRIEGAEPASPAAEDTAATGGGSIKTPELSIRETLRIGRDIADALAFAHSQGLVHRDITPRNIWLESHAMQEVANAEQGPDPSHPGVESFRRVKLLDFGLVRAVEGEPDLTQIGALAGTPAYMSPEQARGEVVDERSDLFSLGCVLYRCLTGVPPFAGLNHLSILRAVELNQPAPPRKLNAKVPAELSDLVMQLLAKKPADRPSSARLVAQQLDEIANTSAAPLHKALRLRTTLIMAVCALSLLFGGLAMFGIFLRITSRDGKSRDVDLQPGDKVEIAEDQSREIPRPEPQLPNQEMPFVLTRADGGREQFQHVTEALAVLGKGDRIEVHGNGPFTLPFVRIDGDLKLSAAPGYRPCFVPHKPDLYWIEVHGALTLDNCDFRAPAGSVIRGDGGTWKIHNCRLLLTGIEFSGADLRISDSLITLSVVHHGSGKLELVNNLARANFGTSGASLLDLSGRVSGHIVHLEHNTFIANNALLHCNYSGAKEFKPAAVTATGNLFYFLENGGPLAAGDNSIKQSVRWQGSDNLYCAFRLIARERDNELALDLSGWNQFWAHEETGSMLVSSARVHFAWSELFTLEPAAAIEKLAGAVNDLRHQHGNALQQLGPAWEVVGSGDAYVRSLTAAGTPIPTKQLRPAAPETGPIVVTRNGQQVAGYVTLVQAVVAAQSGDTIEIRTDGPVAGCDFPPEKGQLTMRAAPGYRPVIEGNFRYWNRLSVEGLHFNTNLSAMSGEGQLSRCANCSFEPAESPVVIGFRDGGHNEIVNCLIPRPMLIAISPNSQHVVKNCILKSIDNAPWQKDGEGQIQIEQSVLWDPWPAMSYGNFKSHPTKCKFHLIARDNLFESGSISGVLWTGVDGLRNAGLAGWEGQRNVYRQAPHGLLADLKRNGFPDEGSLELDPLFFEPHQWALLPESAGYRAGPGGKDFGADVDRIGVTAHRVNEASTR